MRTMGFITGYDNKQSKTPCHLGHSLNIGETGSGQTKAVIRPLIEQAVAQCSNVIIMEEKNRLYLDTNIQD